MLSIIPCIYTFFQRSFIDFYLKEYNNRGLEFSVILSGKKKEPEKSDKTKKENKAPTKTQF